MKNVEGSAGRRDVFPPRRTRLALVVAVVVAMLGTGLTLGLTERDASAVPPAPVDGTVCYAIDEGTGNNTPDPQYLHTIKLDSTGVTSYTHSATPVDASGNIENIALRNDTAEVYAYDPAADQMYLIDVTTPGESIPTDYNLTGLGDIDGMFFQYDEDGDPTNDILWTVTDPDILTGYDTGGNVVGGPIQVALTAPDQIEGATWLPDANGGGGEFFITYVETASSTVSTLASLGTGTTPSASPSAIGTTQIDVEGLGVDGAGNMYLTTGEDGGDANNMYAVDPTDASTTLLQNLTVGAPADGDADFEAVDCAYPKIALSKQLTSDPTVNTNGNYEMEFTFVIENQGELPLENITLSDDFNTVFSPGTLVGTPTYDDVNGDCSSAAAGGTATLNIGESCTAVWQVELQDLPVGDYDNTANVTGAAPNGIGDQVSDDSEDGAAPSDPELDTVTPVAVAANPVIGLTKEVVSAPSPNGDGTYDITYGFTVHNLGNVPLSDVTLTDDYSEFTSAGTLTGPVVADNCPNPLPVGDTCSIVHAVAVNVPPGSYDNTASVTGTDPDATEVSDTSNNGTDPDTDNDGITDEPEDNVPTTIALPESPAIGLTKQATAGPTENADGNYEITYTFTVYNTGDVPLSGVALDDPYTAFSDAGTIVSGPTEDSNTCAGSDLAVSGTCEIVQSIVVDVPPGDYDNTATVTGTSPEATDVTDTSNDGTDPDTDDDGITDEPEDNVETTVTIDENAVIGLAKDVTAGPTENATGNYDLTYTFTVENLGNSDLTNLDLVDTFAEFAAAGTIVAGPTETNNCPATLPVGDTCTIALVVEVNVPPGSYDNNGTISATSVLGTDVIDVSTDGADTDPNADGNPDEQDPTTVSIGEDPIIGLTKQLTAGPTENAAGNYDLEFTFTVYNMGDVALTGVTVADSYGEYAAAGTVVSGPTVTTNTCTGTLAVAGTCQVVHSVEVDVPAGSYDNTATASGTSPLDTIVTDDSNDGTDPDENDNGDPTDPEDDTPTPATIVEGPVIGLTKQVTSGPTVNADGNVVIQYTFTIYNMGDVPLSDASVEDTYSAFAAAGTIVAGPTVVSDDCPTLLAVDDSCVVVEQIEVDVPAGSYDNTATASGVSPGGTTVTDVSNDGVDPDENDNGDPTDPEDETPTNVVVPDPTKAIIGDLVWNDLNGNGLQDAGEPGLPGVGVVVYQVDASGNLIDGIDPIETVTDSNGNWSVEVEPNTMYRVQFTKPTGSDDFTTPNVVGDETRDSDVNDENSGQTGWTTDIYTLSPGETNNDIDAGVKFPPEPGSISNFVWSDENGNGQQDAGEPGIEGITVRLLDSGGNAVDTTTTNAQGEYLFDNVDPGVYTVQVVNTTTGTFTSANQGDDTTDSDVNSAGETQVTLSAGEHNDTIDAGIVPATSTGSLSDLVWEDTNENGLQDADEPGVSGVLVEVLDSTGNVIGEDVTDANGGWHVPNLADGDYTVRFTLPGTREFTAQDAGDDMLDSDADPTTGVTGTYTISGGNNITTVDAGVVPIPIHERGSISDLVWEDTNENGLQDADEPGISGVEVILYNSIGGVVDTVTTGADGTYLHDNLPADDYMIEFVLPGTREFTAQDAGDDTLDSDADPATGRTGNITLAAGQHRTDVDAGVIPVQTTERGSISNYAWSDTNGDGIQDAGEPVMPGVTVTVTDSNGNSYTDVTDSNGEYFIGNLPADTYTVTFTPPGSTTLTVQGAGDDDTVDSDPNPADGKVTVTLPAGEHRTDIDAGVIPANTTDNGSISNFVWEDTNENGLQDAGESGVSGVTVTAYNSAGVPIGSSTTGADGQYLISNLPADTYRVVFDLPGTREFTVQEAGDNTAADSDPDPTTGETTVVLAAGEHRTDVDAGVVPIPDALRGSISNYVWQDADEDGLQDGDESGISGVTVTVSTTAGGIVGSDVTDADGFYLVDNLPAGDYIVTFDVSGDATLTTQGAGDDATVDSDPDPATGEVNVTLGAGEHRTDIDAGVIPVDPAEPGTISDRVWQDLDEDGIQDPGEPGVMGATVTVYNSAGVPVGSMTTDGTGAYSIGDLPAGDYTVGVVPPGTTMVFTAPNSGADDDVDSDIDPTTGRTGTISLAPGQVVDNVDAGLILNKGSISNVVFRDLDGDGVQDDNEGGVAGVTVQAIDADGMVVGEDTTDDNGAYLITGLEPGAYTVKFILPGGQEFTQANAGVNDELDSDPDPDTGITGVITVGAGTNITNVDAGVLPRSVIGLAKAVTSGPAEASDGSHNIVYTFVIENLGDTNLSDIELTDDLASAFSGATIVSGPTASGGTCSAEAMAGTLSLDAGDLCTAVLSVWVSGMAQGTVYRNSATVTGTDPSGAEVSDISDSGSNADPNGNGVPNDSGESDPTPVSLPRLTGTGANFAPAFDYGGPYKVAPTAPTTTFTAPPAQPSAPLAHTGSDSGLLATMALGLLGAGAALMIGARRKRDEQIS